MKGKKCVAAKIPLGIIFASFVIIMEIEIYTHTAKKEKNCLFYSKNSQPGRQ